MSSKLVRPWADMLGGICNTEKRLIQEGGKGYLDPEIRTFYQPIPEIPTSKFADPDIT